MVEDQVVKLKQYIRYCGVTFEEILFELKRLIYENAMDTQYSDAEEEVESGLSTAMPVLREKNRPSSAEQTEKLRD